MLEKRTKSKISKSSEAAAHSGLQKVARDVHQKELRCQHCSAVFVGPRALGGHISKQHKGMSAAYNKKMQVREARTSFRDALYLAKQLVKRHGAAD